MIDITHLIIDGACDFECRVGEKPTSLYLGRLEYERLNEYRKKYLYELNRAEINPLANPVINGMTVYGVNEATHIGYSL